VKNFNIFALFLIVLSPLPSSWSAEKPAALDGVGVTEHLGARLSVEKLRFSDEQGKTVSLQEFFKKGHPVVLNLVYYECPQLCNFILNGLVTTLKNLDWVPGTQFEMVAVSINPKETPALAEKKKEAYLKVYGKPETRPGWHFLTGEESQIRELADQVGFGYRYDPVDKQYLHAAVTFVITPEGKISRYLYGINFPKKDLRFALLEASHGKIGNVVDQVLLFCFHYDPNRGGYSPYGFRFMQIACCFLATLLFSLLFYLWRLEKSVRRESENNR
jgi:protein SCO1/2